MALRLSHKINLSLIVKPWALIKYQVHIICGSMLSAPINYALVELFTLILCFFAIPMTDSLPKDIVNLECPLMYGCAAYDASTHHLIIVRISALKISGILIV